MTKLLKNMLRGAGAILDLRPWGSDHVVDIWIPQHSDGEALGKDWAQVGEDLKTAFRQASREIPLHVEKE